MELDDWQKEIVEDESKYILLCKGRQIGGTTTLAEKAVKWMIEKKAKILVGSITEEQAKLVIVMVYDILCRIDKKYVCKGKDKPTQDKIKLVNGAEIRSRPVGTMGDSFRGFTGDVAWLNEASSWSELAIVSIMPVLMTTGGAIWADSTPKGKFKKDGGKTWFYSAFENLDNRWKIYYKSSKQAILERKISKDWTIERREASLRFLSDQEKEMSAVYFGQEYGGLFMEELKQAIDEEVINQAMRLKRPEAVGSGRHTIGVDVGGQGEDPTVITVGEEINNKVYQRENIIMKKTYTTQVTTEIIRQKKKFNTKNEYVDDGGIGFGVFSELLNDSLTANSVEAINNSSRPVNRDATQKKRIRKEELYLNMIKMLEKGELVLLDDEEIRESLRSIQLEITEDGQRKYHGRNSHNAEALIRMVAGMIKVRTLNVWAY